MIESTIQGVGNLTVTSQFDARNGTITGAGRVIIPVGAIATLNPTSALTIVRRFDVDGTVQCSGPLVIFLTETTFVNAGGQWSSNAQTLVFNNGAMLENSGEASIHAQMLTLQNGGRIHCSGALTLDGLAVGTPMIVNGDTGSGPPATISSNGPITIGDRSAGVNMFMTGQRGEFVGPVSVLGGALTVNHKTRFFKTVTVASGASLALNPRLDVPNAISLEGWPAVQGAGEVVLNQGTYSIPFPLAGSNPMRLNSATVTFNTDQTFSAPVSLTGSYLRGPANLTFTNRLDLNNGQLQGPGGTTFAASCQTFVNTAANPNFAGGGIAGPCVNRGAITVSAGFWSASGSQLTNSGLITLNTDSSYTVSTVNSAAGTINAASLNATPILCAGLLQNFGNIHVQSGVLQFGSRSLGGLPVPINSGTIQVDAGTTLRFEADFVYAPGSSLINLGSIDYVAGAHDPGTAVSGGGPYIVRQAARLTLRQPEAPPTGSVDGTLTLVTDQTWSTLVLKGHLAGPGNLHITQLLDVDGFLDVGGSVEILPGAAMTVTNNISTLGGVTLSRPLMNRGALTVSANNLNFVSATLDNRGQFTIERRLNIGTSGTGNAIINSGTMTCNNGEGSSPLEFPGPNPSHPSTIPLQFVNSGTLNVIGELLISGGGSSTTKFTVGVGNSLAFGATYTFAQPIAIDGSGDVGFENGEFDFSVARLASTGAMNFAGVVTIGHAVTPSSANLGGTVNVLVDQVWPPFALSGMLAGPGNISMTGNGHAGDWSNAQLMGPGTLTIAAGVSVGLPNAGSPTVLRTTLINNGTMNVGRLQLSNGTLNNNGQVVLGGIIDGAGSGGVINNSGTLLVNASSTITSTVQTPVQLRNTGLVRVVLGTATLQNVQNYDAVTHALTGGAWTIEGTGTLNIAGSDVRSIGLGTTISLLTPGAAFPALANLTSNAGTLVLGPGRTQNINPIGGTFTNSGELSLRAGSLFNVVGNFIQTAIGTLRTQIGGPLASQIGRLAATGSVTLGGTIITEYTNGYTPASCNATLPFISAASVTGTFTSATTAPINGRVSRVVVGSSIAALSVRNPADVATIGGLPPGDNALTADDVIVYLNAFFSNNLTIADVAALGGALTPDGATTTDDLIAFLNSFFAGCN